MVKMVIGMKYEHYLLIYLQMPIMMIIDLISISIINMPTEPLMNLNTMIGKLS